MECCSQEFLDDDPKLFPPSTPAVENSLNIGSHPPYRQHGMRTPGTYTFSCIPHSLFSTTPDQLVPRKSHAVVAS